ncbi:putative holin-like toxin [Rummeliibacillus suwonensis]|nr:putative holin-like toxin [Rummeliibacillus suwonensis]
MAHSSSEGGEAMSVLEALMFAIAFATLVIAILSFNHKK